MLYLINRLNQTIHRDSRNYYNFFVLKYNSIQFILILSDNNSSKLIFYQNLLKIFRYFLMVNSILHCLSSRKTKFLQKYHQIYKNCNHRFLCKVNIIYRCIFLLNKIYLFYFHEVFIFPVRFNLRTIK